MYRTRRFAASLILLPVLVVTLTSARTAWADSPHHGDDPAEGGSTTSITLRLPKATIPWAFPEPDGMTSTCSDIPAGVNINPDEGGSNRVQQAAITARTDGTQLVVVTDNTNGTAHDNSGTVYRFVYYNKATLDFDGKIVNVRMVDTFRMRGGQVNMNVSFDWKWAYTPTNGITVSVMPQYIQIDPWPFAVTQWPAASAEALKENPDIVPGSWVQLSSRGTPWSCDPL